MENKKPNIFYAHSSRDAEVSGTYDKICQELSECVNIYDYENNISANIGKTIFTQIYESDLLLVDITPDCVNGEKITMNEHVMIELGYGLSVKSEEQIIIIYNEDKYDYTKNKNNIPVFIDGKQLNDRFDTVNKYTKMIDNEYIEELKDDMEENKDIIKRCEEFKKMTYDTIKTTLYNEGKKIKKNIYSNIYE